MAVLSDCITRRGEFPDKKGVRETEQTMKTITLLQETFVMAIRCRKVPLKQLPMILYALFQIQRLKMFISKVKNRTELQQMLSDMDKTLYPYLKEFEDFAEKIQNLL